MASTVAAALVPLALSMIPVGGAEVVMAGVVSRCVMGKLYEVTDHITSVVFRMAGLGLTPMKDNITTKATEFPAACSTFRPRHQHINKLPQSIIQEFEVAGVYDKIQLVRCVLQDANQLACSGSHKIQIQCNDTGCKSPLCHSNTLFEILLQLERILSMILQEFQTMFGNIDNHKRLYFSSWRQVSHEVNVKKIITLVGTLEYWKSELFTAIPWVRFTMSQSTSLATTIHPPISMSS